MDALSLFFPAHVTLALSFYLFLWLLPFFLQSFLPFRISVILSGTSLFPLSFPAILVSPRCLFLALSHFCLKLLLVLPLSSIYCICLPVTIDLWQRVTRFFLSRLPSVRQASRSKISKAQNLNHQGTLC